MKITKIENLDNNEYHNSEKYSEYWSSSNIKKYMETPKEAKFQKDDSTFKETDAMRIGTQIHDYLASKHIKGQPFEYNVFEPPVNPKTQTPYGKTTKTYLDALSYVDNPITADEMELINDIWSMIKKSDYAWYFEKEILGKGIAEPSFFVDGLHKYKYRPDVVTDKYIFDYKSITKMYWGANKLHKLNARVTDLGYDISASMYQYFEHVRTGIWKPFIIIWLMKEPPFDILVHDISPYCYESYGKDNQVIVNSGANVWLKLKDQHELCQISDQWPGLANQFDKWNGKRMAQFPPRYENYFDPFEIDNKR